MTSERLLYFHLFVHKVPQYFYNIKLIKKLSPFTLTQTTTHTHSQKWSNKL